MPSSREKGALSLIVSKYVLIANKFFVNMWVVLNSFNLLCYQAIRSTLYFFGLGN